MLAKTPVSSRFMLAGVLSIASLTFWFSLGFPWDHHNESLVWAVELARVTFWDTLSSNPITPVQTYRPLGVGLAWLTFHGTNGGIWLQQLINFLITAFAWLLALRGVENRQAFAWLSFMCAAGYFSGYIYLFHLHGVFYGPLFVYLAFLINAAQREPPVMPRLVILHLALAIAVAFFHTFSLLFYAAFIGGLWVEDKLKSRSTSLWSALGGLATAALLLKVLASSAPGLGDDSPLLGSLATYRALELNFLLSILSAMLVALLVFSLGVTARIRWIVFGCVLTSLLLMSWFKIPLIIAWICACILKALWMRRIALSALIGVTALLPVATGTGSPTYALFTIMPCIVVTIAGLNYSAAIRLKLEQLGIAALMVMLAVFVAAKMQITIPVVSNQVRALQAEKEKTQQLMEAFAWLDAHPEIHGALRLCEPGDFPVRSNTAIVRTYRAPTHAWPFGEYVRSRYGDRFAKASPEVLLCFGGQLVPSTTLIHEIHGHWAGSATLLSR